MIYCMIQQVHSYEITQEKITYFLNENSSLHIYSSLIYAAKNWKQHKYLSTVVYHYYEIPLKNKNEWTIDAFNNMVAFICVTLNDSISMKL